VRLWQWLAVLPVVAASVPALLVALALASYLPLAVPLAALLGLPTMHRYLARYGERFRCRLGRDGLMVERGVCWRSDTFVPRARVQHTDIGHGPLGRRLGIATLKVFTAGSHVGEIDIRGLGLADAVALRDNLLGRDGRDAL
jgi:membrane protein YdbS with pleckstrin-like domain